MMFSQIVDDTSELWMITMNQNI